MAAELSSIKFGTKAIHAGQNPEQWKNNEIVPPIAMSSIFKQDTPGKPKKFFYSKYGNSSRDVLQQNLAVLEGGKHGYAFGSGMGAIMSTILLLKPGDHIICDESVYGGTIEYLNKIGIPRNLLTADFIDFTNLNNLKNALKPETQMILFESPSNPLLKLVDISEAVKITKAHNKDILIVADNTFMTPYFQNPLKFGVDIVVHSLSKYINGHNDVVMGAVVINDSKYCDHFSSMQKIVGAVPSPFDCYLVTRGIKTLHIRMKRHYKNALAVAKFLEKHQCVEKVLYPALESHPQHEIHKKQAIGMSGMIAVYLKGEEKEATAFLEALQVVTIAASLGGCETTVTLPALMSHENIPREHRIKVGISDGLIRLSIGLEDIEDLIADFDQALKHAILDKN
jgi:cystathionine gamma-lyase